MLRAEEERFTETLARGMKLFEEVAARRRHLRQGRVRPHRDLRLPVRADARAGARARDPGRRGRLPRADGRAPRGLARRRLARGRRRCPGRRAEFVGYEQTEVLTAIVALNDLGDGTFEAKLERSPFYPAGGGQVADQGWIEHDETGARAELRDAVRLGDDQTLVFEGDGLRRRATASRPSCPGRCASRRWRTTPRRISCTRRSGACSASTSSRRARPSARTSSASTSRTSRR